MTKLVECGSSIEEIAKETYNALRDGGLVLVPDCIGYGLVAHSEESVRKIYSLKERDFSKTLTHYMNLKYCRNVADISEQNFELIEKVTREAPCCFIVPLQQGTYYEHPYFSNLSDFALNQSTEKGTIALFFENESPLVNDLTALALEDNFALIVSSANKSGEGNTYEFTRVPATISENCNLTLYYKEPCKHIKEASQPKESNLLGATIVDIKTKKILRHGVFANTIANMIKNIAGCVR